jgi:hypothetical protein
VLVWSPLPAVDLADCVVSQVVATVSSPSFDALYRALLCQLPLELDLVLDWLVPLLIVGFVMMCLPLQNMDTI